MTLFEMMNNGAGLDVGADEAGARLPVSVTNGEGDCSVSADAATPGVSPSQPNDGESRTVHADEVGRILPSPSINSGAGLSFGAEKADRSMPDPASIAALGELQVRRKFYINTVNRQTNAAKALVRRALGWKYDDEDGAREKMNKRAARIVAAALAGKEQKPEDIETFGVLAFDLDVIAAAIEPCMKARHEIELEMKRVARKLPVAGWAKDVKGLGELGLAVIVGEAGDLSTYPKKGHLWKRLGLAPYDGKAFSTWRMKGGLSAEEWTEAGYSPRRRAEIYAVISEPLFRQQTVVQGPYRGIYDRRRERTAESHPDWTKAHSHMDGLRVMTKHLIRDLWVAWRGQRCSADEASERPARQFLEERATP